MLIEKQMSQVALIVAASFFCPNRAKKLIAKSRCTNVHVSTAADAPLKKTKLNSTIYSIPKQV
jgi:radical SAM superfamily enzyme